MPIQKASFLLESGVIAVDTSEIQKIGAGEVLIRIQAAAINPVDLKTQQRVYKRGYPHIMGFDVAGDIAAVGEEVDGLSGFPCFIQFRAGPG